MTEEHTDSLSEHVVAYSIYFIDKAVDCGHMYI